MCQALSIPDRFQGQALCHPSPPPAWMPSMGGLARSLCTVRPSATQPEALAYPERTCSVFRLAHFSRISVGCLALRTERRRIRAADCGVRPDSRRLPAWDTTPREQVASAFVVPETRALFILPIACGPLHVRAFVWNVQHMFTPPAAANTGVRPVSARRSARLRVSAGPEDTRRPMYF